jgi:hypothetical protein
LTRVISLLLLVFAVYGCAATALVDSSCDDKCFRAVPGIQQGGK